MLKNFRTKLAGFIAPHEAERLAEKERGIELLVNQRVADFLMKMDPFEPLLKKYHVIFSEEYANPEDKLDEPGQLQLFMWAYGVSGNKEFKFLVDWLRNTQGNATLRKAKNDHEWLYGRAAVATISLFTEEVSRLASRYKDILAKRDGKEFDESLAVE